MLTRILLIAGLVPFLVLFFPQLNHSAQAHLGPTDDALYGGYFIVTSNSTHSDGTGWPEDHCSSAKLIKPLKILHIPPISTP
jgi:hypothetical protein